MIITENYLEGFFRADDKGKPCGKGFISSRKKCKVGTSGGAVVKQSRSKRLSRYQAKKAAEAEKTAKNVETAKKIGTGAIAGALVGAGAAAAYGIAASMKAREEKSKSTNDRSLSSKPTPLQPQVYDKSLPSDRDFNRATLTELTNPTSSGGQRGVNKIFSTTIGGKDFFVKSPSRNGDKFGQIAAAKEVAAFDIAKAVGIDKHFLPIKKFSKDEKLFLATPMLKQDEIQKFPTVDELTQKIENIPEKQAADFLVFDYVMTLSARHNGNILFKKDGTPLIIDNGSIRRDIQLPDKKIRATKSLKMQGDKNIFYNHSFDKNPDTVLPPETLKKFTKKKAEIRKIIENRYSGLPEKVVYDNSKKVEKKISLLENMVESGDTRIRRLIEGK